MTTGVPEKPTASGTPVRLRTLTRDQWRSALRGVRDEALAGDAMDLAAGLTYYSVLAIFPGLLAVVSLLGIIGREAQLATVMNDALEGVIPGAMLALLHDLVTQLQESSGSRWTLLAGVFGAVWSSSAYIGAAGRALNRLHGLTENRPWWRIQARQLLMALAVLVLTITAVLAITISGRVAGWLAGWWNLSPAMAGLLPILRWPVLVLVAIGLVAAVYNGAPARRVRRVRWVSPGAVIAMATWAIVSIGFMVYVANFGTYNKTYGTLGAVIIFLLWLYLANLALLAGAHVDAALERLGD